MVVSEAKFQGWGGSKGIASCSLGFEAGLELFRGGISHERAWNSKMGFGVGDSEPLLESGFHDIHLVSREAKAWSGVGCV